MGTGDGRGVKTYWCRLETILRKSVDRFSRVRRSNDSNVTRVCWRGNDVNTSFKYPRERSRRHWAKRRCIREETY